MNTYKIDGVAVNSRPDWRRRRAPVQSQAQIYSFPGISARASVDPAAIPADEVITGFLEATGDTGEAAADNLDDLVDTYQAMVDDGLVHTMQSHAGYTNDECKLMSFRETGSRDRADFGGQTVMKVGVEFTWRFLSSATTATP